MGGALGVWVGVAFASPWELADLLFDYALLTCFVVLFKQKVEDLEKDKNIHMLMTKHAELFNHFK